MIYGLDFQFQFSVTETPTQRNSNAIVFPYWACKNPLARTGSSRDFAFVPAPHENSGPKNYLISILRGGGLFPAHIDKVR